VLALPHLPYPVHAQPGQRTHDRLTLRIKDFRFGDDVDDHPGHILRLPGFAPVVARWTAV
jgi:hypothetical protein